MERKLCAGCRAIRHCRFFPLVRFVTENSTDPPEEIMRTLAKTGLEAQRRGCRFAMVEPNGQPSRISES